MTAVFLQAIDGGGIAVNAAADQVTGNGIALLEAQIPVAADGVGSTGQKPQCVRNAAICRGHHQSDCGLVGKLAAQPAD